MDHSAEIVKNLRIAPTVQQGGTQTIQQSIYLAHNNPCGANVLIFQEMGETQIRYIDLKNLLDQILQSEQMKFFFEKVRIAGTAFINNPLNEQLVNAYVYALGEWAYNGILNLPIPVLQYPGYRIKFSVYDASGCILGDSNFPFLNPAYETGGTYYLNYLPMVPNPSGYGSTQLYKLSNNYTDMPYLDRNNFYVYTTLLSDYVVNQLTLPETIMSVSSLLVDSANTRTFGIPTYGFSARSNANGLGLGGIGYHCCQFINIRTTPDENGKTTLVETIFARLSIEEDVLFTGSAIPLSIEPKEEARTLYTNIVETIRKKQQTANQEQQSPQENDVRYQQFIKENQDTIFLRSVKRQQQLDFHKETYRNSVQ